MSRSKIVYFMFYNQMIVNGIIVHSRVRAVSIKPTMPVCDAARIHLNEFHTVLN